MDSSARHFRLLLLLAVFVVATCGLVYELVAGTLASYLLGDSITQFSLIIGTYLFSMGVGSYLSQFFKGNLIAWFIRLEVLVGVVGGFTSTLLYLLFEQASAFGVALYGLVGLTGTLVGIEIPLIMRILKDRFEFSNLVSSVFTFDYIGALVASIVFPLLLIPHLGILRTSFLFGFLNVAVALAMTYLFAAQLARPSWLRIQSLLAMGSLVVGFVYSNEILAWSETAALGEPIVYSTSSPYQRIVLTHNRNELKLYLNGNLQFNSADEYRYHEALVHPGMAALPRARRVLVLGGGDGMAVRELLRYPVEEIVLVDLDPAVTRLFRQVPMLQQLNGNSLSQKSVKVINADAFTWLADNAETFDFVVIDFPDPGNFSVGKLYTDRFYRMLKRHLHPGSLVVVQSTSPYFAPQAYWCVVHTLQTAGFATMPYHAYVPSFGDWGYVLAGSSQDALEAPRHYPRGLRFVGLHTLDQMRHYPPDMAERPTEINKLNNQVLVHYFEKEWGRVN